MSFLLLGVILFISCEKQPAPFTPDRQAGTETVQMEQSDSELLRIAEDARRTLPVFFQHLTRAGAGENNFCIKHPFKADNGAGFVMEQVWLTGIYFKNGEYYGILAGAPMLISGMEKGDTRTFDIEAITDWMYVRNGKITGGRSIKYLLENIPENRRSDEQRKILQMFEP